MFQVNSKLVHGDKQDKVSYMYVVIPMCFRSIQNRVYRLVKTPSLQKCRNPYVFQVNSKSDAEDQIQHCKDLVVIPMCFRSIQNFKDKEVQYVHHQFVVIPMCFRSIQNDFDVGDDSPDKIGS